jgi:hypothetical protein
MIDKENLTNNNFLEYAMSSYIHFCWRGISEFYYDLLKIKYLKRLFRKYNEIGEIDDARLRLALNHLIVFYNLFPIQVATRILFFKLEPALYPILKTFLIFLNYQPAIVNGINGKDIVSKKIIIHDDILERLKTLGKLC